MAKIDRVLVGESLVGDGNEVAHIDLIMARAAVRWRPPLQCPHQQQRRLHRCSRW
jgi:hypothetical protein